MFVFPGLLGRSFNLPPERIAYLYGMTFAVCGVITILQSVLLLRLPIIQGPYAGNFAALLAVGHLRARRARRRLRIILRRVAHLVCAHGTDPAMELHRPLRALPARADHFRHDRDADDHSDCECGAAQLDRRVHEPRLSAGEPVCGHRGGRSADRRHAVGRAATAARCDSGRPRRRHGVLRLLPADFLCRGLERALAGHAASGFLLALVYRPISSSFSCSC